jgi:peptidoglycan/LPS O-acetylase OafA/YrhL
VESNSGRSTEIGMARPDMPALTSLRFVAAAYIVILHRWRDFLPSFSGARYWNEFLSLGYIAVSFFFVLSGFVLAVVYLRGGRAHSFNKSAFWLARIARIYPVFILSLLASAPFALLKQDSHGDVYHGIKAVFLTVTNFTFMSAWHPWLAGNWNRPSWSVSVEAFFYLIFPFMGAWVARRKDVVLWIGAGAWLTSLASSLICLSLFPNMASHPMRLEMFLFNPLLRCPEFIIGVCCGVAFLQGRTPVKQRSMWFGMLICLASIPLLVKLPWLLVSNGLLAPLFGVVILGLADSEGPAARFLSNRPLVLLGQASFSLYLLHFPVFFWMSFAVTNGSFAQRLTGSWPYHTDSVLSLILYFVLAVLFSLASYTFIEIPARDSLKEWFSQRGSRSVSVPRRENGQEAVVS